MDSATNSHSSDGGRSPYDPHAIEARRQRAWDEQSAFRTPVTTGDRRRKYIKPSAPFTSGNVHIGHVRSYSIGDAYARFCRARGEDVLFAFGFDSFGLPAELGAIAGKESPSTWVDRCAQHMTGQLRRLGFSFDWERAFMSSDAIMYRWSPVWCIGGLGASTGATRARRRLRRFRLRTGRAGVATTPCG
jgi:leucyl-tRNA synthetase